MKTALLQYKPGATLAHVSVASSSSGPCVAWGGYGYGNTGDDLVLAVALADLRRTHGHVQVLSPDPDHTRLAVRDEEVILYPQKGRARPLREKWFWRLTAYAEDCNLRSLAARLYRMALKNPQRVAGENAWLRALASASSLHLAGGGYLAERFDWRNFLKPVRLARSGQLPITTSPLGLGPFPSHAKAAALADALRGSRLIVRDEDSLRLCQAQALAAVEMPDDGFRLRQVVDLPATKPASSIGKAIGVCIFNQYSPSWSERVGDWWVACLKALAGSFPHHRLEGFCFHTCRDMDYETTRRLFTRAGLSPDNVRLPQPDFREAIASLQPYQAIVSTRFHAVVTASVLEIPSVAVVLDDYYVAKMRGALKHAPTPMSLLNPLSDPPQAAAQWLATKLGL